VIVPRMWPESVKSPLN